MNFIYNHLNPGRQDFGLILPELAFLFLIKLIFACNGHCAGIFKPTFTLVSSGKAICCIETRDKDSKILQTAINELSYYVEKSSGADIQICGPDTWENLPRIYLGLKNKIKNSDMDCKELHPDGFVIDVVDDKKLVISGATDTGTLFGVYEFLEQFVGVRWLFPGPLGEDIPKRKDLIIPQISIREKPVFFSRQISGFPNDIQRKWAERMRLKGHVRFSHNMNRIIPPEQYTNTHPEFFPIINGKRFLPSDNRTQGWQPCFHAPGIVEEAVENVCKYFAELESEEAGKREGIEAGRTGGDEAENPENGRQRAENGEPVSALSATPGKQKAEHSGMLPEDPDRDTFSLGVNDFGGYCDDKGKVQGKGYKVQGKGPENGKQRSENGRQRTEDRSSSSSGQVVKRNFMGRIDRSDEYFAWANAVAEGVLKTYPDKWFGCLAYDDILDPPETISVHPRIIPYMTYDRMKWVHKEIDSTGKKITKEWDTQTHVLGWYDYIYGSVYHVPRVYFHKMAEYYQFAAENGVSALNAEAIPNWGEGPKLYVAVNLMWNPNIDVNAMLTEWYTRMVGKDAADDLAAYYDLWEDFWTRRILETDWFVYRGQFLPFWKTGYLELVTFEDIIKSRELLESVVRKAGTTIQNERAQLLLKAFEYYEASALSYLGLMIGKKEPGKDLAYYKMMHRKRKELVDAFENDPVLVHPTRFDRKFSWAEIDPFNVIEGTR